MSHPRENHYYAVIFTSRKKAEAVGYDEMANRMEQLRREQPGFLAIESTRNSDGLGITVSYWKSLDDIANWKANVEHLSAQRQGRDRWYESYDVKVCRVEKEYSFGNIK